MLKLDHVVFAVRDLDEAAGRLLEEHGLASVPGGSHDGVGTANRIVPLGQTYVELMAVVDPEVAAQNTLGRYLTSFLAGGDRLLNWCVATDDIASDARRIGASVNEWHRTRPDGVDVRWRLAGVEGAMADRSLPFFIRWDDDAPHPGTDAAAHRTGVGGIKVLTLAGDPRKVGRRLGGAEMPIDFVAGDAGPVALTISTDAGDVVLR